MIAASRQIHCVRVSSILLITANRNRRLRIMDASSVIIIALSEPLALVAAWLGCHQQMVYSIFCILFSTSFYFHSVTHFAATSVFSILGAVCDRFKVKILFARMQRVRG